MITENNANFIMAVAIDQREECDTLGELAWAIGYEAAWAAYKLRGSYLSRKYTDQLGLTLTTKDRAELMRMAVDFTGYDYNFVIGRKLLTIYGYGLLDEVRDLIEEEARMEEEEEKESSFLHYSSEAIETTLKILRSFL